MARETVRRDTFPQNGVAAETNDDPPGRIRQGEDRAMRDFFSRALGHLFLGHMTAVSP